MRWFAMLVLVGSAALSGCEDDSPGVLREDTAALVGGDAERGREKIAYYGCASCHEVPGVYGAQGVVGPSLDRIGSRNYLAGVLPNTPDNLVRWIKDPPAIDPRTAMPKLGLTDQDARDIASYLYTLP